MAGRWLDILKLSERECDDLLDYLATPQRVGEVTTSPRSKESRRSSRWRFRASPCPMRVEHPDGGEGHFLVCTRDVSAGGAAVLHGGFLYPGSSCEITLRTRRGETQVLAGTIAFCRHVRGTAHLIGIRFDARIDPSTFINYSDAADDRLGAPELPQLRGRILWLDEDTTAHALVEHYLSATAVSVVIPKSIDEVLGSSGRLPGDMVMMDLSFGGIAAPEIVKRIRDERRFAGPIVLLTADSHNPTVRDALAAGATNLIEKPFDRSSLLKQLAQILQEAGLTIDQDSMRSRFDGDENYTALIRDFVEQVRSIGQLIEEAVASDDMDSVRKHCLSIRGSAPGFGFQAIADVANVAVKSLDATMSIPETNAPLTKLCCFCREVRAPEK